MRTLDVRRNPWTMLNNTLWNDGFWNLINNDGYEYGDVKRSAHNNFPRCDISETEQGFLMSFDLPGIKKEDLQIEVKDNVLTLSGERKGEGKKEGYSERFYGTFERAFTLPETVDADKIEAHFENGVLQLALPKAEAKKGKKIEIGTGAENKGIFSKLLNHAKAETAA